MADAPLIDQQGLRDLPRQEGMSEATNLISPPQRVPDRLAHFDPDLYDLEPESHLSRFMKVMLGDAGAGRLAKAALVARLQHSLHGSHFFDLDRFYGGIFGAQRRLSEIIEGDPFSDARTDEEWDEVGAKDDSYRSRMEQFARAINYGATPTGLRLAAEALLSAECDVYESFVSLDRAITSYGDLEGEGTYGSVEGLGTYGDLESDGGPPVGSLGRAVFTIVPKREITDEEHYDLIRVLSVLKPAASILRIQPLGRPHMVEVPLRRIAADSEMWRIIKKSVADGGTTARPRPPFTAYQGEAWSHLGGISGVAAYALDAHGAVKDWGLFGSIRVGNHTYTYTPDLAVAPLSRIFGGRSVSDGIMVQHPYVGARRGNRIVVYYDQDFYNQADQFRPDQNRGVLTTGLWSDGYFVLDPGQPILFSGNHKTRQTFWASPERAQSDPTSEVVEMRFRSPQLVNNTSLELARFPHTATVQAWSAEDNDWVDLRRWTVSESFPERVIHRTATGDIHPQHSLAGHWKKASSNVKAIRTDRLRIVLKRTTSARPPVDAKGRPLPYSLAVRNWDVGYRIRDRSDIPAPDESLGGGFATTLDSRGATMVLDVAENPASWLLSSNVRTWRSEPQPTNRAVVNAYLDARGADGKGQVINAFYLDPTRSGPHMNLYWSDQEDYGPFPASDDAIDLSSSGVVYHSAKGLTFSDADSAWVEIDNGEVQFDPGAADWWMGFRYTPFHATVDSGDLRVLFTDGEHLTVMTGYDPMDGAAKAVAVAIDADGNVTTAICDLDAAPSDIVFVSVSYDAEAKRLSISTKVRDEVASGDAVSVDVIPRSNTLFIGGHPTTAGGDFVLSGFFLKVGLPPDPVEAMAASFESYLLRAAPGRNTNDYTTNSILRYHPMFSSEDQIVFRGGPAQFWDSLTWHPVERDYKLAKGYINVPPTKAKFWNFEFTNLVPEPMESLLPITRRVRIFPPDVSGINTPRPTRPPADQWPGMRVGTREAGNAQYRDTPLNNKTVPSLPPTAAQYVPDIQQAAKMRSLSWLYGMQPWQIGHTAPRFREVGLHRYDEFDIVDTSKIGFFVGLRQIVAYRTDYERDDDTEVYREHFHDDNAMEDGYTWDMDPGHLYATIQGATASSKTFRSRHPVRAVQFAAQQSEPVQIVPDDDFRDERLTESTWDDDTAWHSYGDGTISYLPHEYAVVVQRDTSAISGGSGGVGVGSTLLTPLPTPVFSYRADAGSVPLSQAAGGIESGLSATSPRGMIHAAARVTAITDTANPLLLQIIGEDGTVLAESQRFMKKGETAEWYIGYQLGSFDRAGFQLFERRSLIDRPFREVFDHTAPDTTGDVPSVAPDELVRVRLIQEGTSTDSWKVDRLSIFDDAMLWEFSNDGGEEWYEALGIRSNPDGVLAFPRSGNGLRWRVTAYRPGRHVTSLQIRPWYERQMGVVMGVPQRGPNTSAFDHDPPVDQDPEFKVWPKPVPKWWWLEGRKFPILPTPGEPLTNPDSAFYARTASDTLDAISDTPGWVLSAIRSVTEDIPRASDEAAAGSGVYTRTADPSETVLDDDVFLSRIHPDPQMRRLPSPPPVAGD